MGKLMKAVAYVTIFSILTRALGFLLRIYLSRVLGAELLGSYQMAMNVFSVLLTLVASGLPTIIGRTTANLRGKNEVEKCHKFVSSGLIFALVISVISCLVIRIFPQILDTIFNNPHSKNIVFFLLPGIVASSFYTILRGALWGQKKFFTISFAEFFEQSVRIIILFILVSLPLSLGLDERAALSLSIACIFSAIFVIICYFVHGGRLYSPKGTMRPLLKSSAPITAVRTISNLVTSAISLIIPSRLMLSGLSSSEALAKYGVVMGMSFPLLMIPGTLIGSITVAFVPEISEQTTNIDKEVKNKTTLKNQIGIALGLATIISFLLLPAFSAVGDGIGLLLYGNLEAGKYLKLSAFLMIPLGISQISGAILNTIGLEIKSLKNSAISAVLLFLCIYFLPKYLGVGALILGMACLSVTQSVLNLTMLKKRDILTSKVFTILLIMICVSIPATLIGSSCYNLLLKLVSPALATIIGALISTISLALFVLCTNLANVRGFVFNKLKHNKTAI